ncbi:MAG: general secretion pathway protein GspB [Aquabacterium sp.]|uniref:general secretion pathway protein GspB n=1 Tax=Aquabacterium sp. TaxID=1872578 RepID=UPI003BE64BE3
MSYILDALKKADAERERAAVPGLHTAATPLADDALPKTISVTPLAMGFAAVALAALGVMGWQLWQHAATPTPAPAQPSSPPPMMMPPPMQPPASMPAPAPSLPASQPMPVPPQAQPSPTPFTDSVRQSTPQQPVASRPSSTPKVTTPATANSPILRLNELPEEMRRTLPNMVFGGAMYSDVPSKRMLIINGGVFHEGDQPMSGLSLDEIRLKSAVFSYQGQRFSVAY